MMRQTGGVAVAAISTRSRPFWRAIASAWGGGMMPSCSPLSSMTRTSRTRMRSLIRVRSSRRGLRSKAITTSSIPLYVGLHPISRLVARGDPCAPRRSSQARRARLGLRGGHDLGFRLVLPLRGTFGLRQADELIHAPRALIPAAAAADRDRALGRFAVAGHEHVGDLLQLRFA